jgi:hypothetical protein
MDQMIKAHLIVAHEQLEQLGKASGNSETREALERIRETLQMASNYVGRRLENTK